jgi:hypothetical protein
MAKLDLTSVKVIPSEYKQFKIICLDTGTNLQKLVNRCIILYTQNKEVTGNFRDIIDGFSIDFSGSAI